MDDNEKPASDTPFEQSFQNLIDVIKNPADKKQLTESIFGRRKDKGVRGGDYNKPYYRAKYAIVMKEVMDDMIKNRKPVIYRYSDFSWLSTNSLYLRIMQSIEYLLDNMDPNGSYSMFRQALNIKIKRGVGVVLHIREDLLTDDMSEFKPSPVTLPNEEWRSKLNDFLEKAAGGEVYYNDSFACKDDEKDLLVHQLTELQDKDLITFIITSHSLKIVKL